MTQTRLELGERVVHLANKKNEKKRIRIAKNMRDPLSTLYIMLKLLISFAQITSQLNILRTQQRPTIQCYAFIRTCELRIRPKEEGNITGTNRAEPHTKKMSRALIIKRTVSFGF